MKKSFRLAKEHKPVIIMGTGYTQKYCPFDVEVWGCNGAYTIKNYDDFKDKFRLDKLFITDFLYSVEGTLNFDIQGMNELVEKYGTEIVSLHPMPGLKSIRYPFWRIRRKFKSNYFTSSICHMIAYAIDKGYNDIRLYGIDMSSKREYILQKAGVEYWMGYAQGAGARIFVAEGSTILVPPTIVPYGQKMKYDLKDVDPFKLMKGKYEEFPIEEEKEPISVTVERWRCHHCLRDYDHKDEAAKCPCRQVAIVGAEVPVSQEEANAYSS